MVRFFEEYGDWLSHTNSSFILRLLLGKTVVRVDKSILGGCQMLGDRLLFNDLKIVRR